MAEMSINDLGPAIIALVMIGILAGAGSIAINSLSENIILDLPLTTVSNEQITANNVTAQSLANDWVQSISTVSVQFNTTANRTLASDEFTVTNLQESINAQILVTNDSLNGNATFVNYTFHDELASTAANATEQGEIGIGNLTSFLGTIGTLIAIAALIGVVVGAFYYYGGRRQM